MAKVVEEKKHELSPEVAKEFDLSDDMHPTSIIIGQGWGKKYTGQTVDFRTMKLSVAKELAALKHEDTDEPFPFLVPKKKADTGKGL